MTFKRVWETKLNGELAWPYETLTAALVDARLWKDAGIVHVSLRSYVVPA